MEREFLKEYIEALTIISKYGDKNDPSCISAEHDQLYVGQEGTKKEDVSEEDMKRLDELGFFWDEDFECWGSFV